MRSAHMHIESFFDPATFTFMPSADEATNSAVRALIQTEMTKWSGSCRRTTFASSERDRDAPGFRSTRHGAGKPGGHSIDVRGGAQ